MIYTFIQFIVLVFKADLKQLEYGKYDSNDPYSFRNKFVKELDEVRTCTGKQ